MPSIGQAALHAETTDLPLGDPAFPRCPIDDVDAVLSDDGSALSVLYTGYEVYVEEGRRRGRASCTMTIPVHVPEGKAVALVDADYRGFVEILERGTVRFSRRYKLGPKRTGWRHTAYRGVTEEDLELTDAVRLKSHVRRDCGKDTTLRIETRVVVAKPRRADDVFVALDSADVTGAMELGLTWEDCE